MSDVVIKVENLYKQYRLGETGTGTLSHDLNRFWHKLRGKEDPYLKIGEENNRNITGNSDYVWALQDINFEVKQGEVLGIIGRNGAGKSTLLKLLSRITTPTKGSIKAKGRIASLLEVGTGFHPELSGRDNIFLNGAILGMTKREIKDKFDAIVDFAGVERYIDTPVKRYSSGMYVRLAFAVAAHLESEILIVDEVLAVGDAEFQAKCLGKMKDVSNKEGRTVLFVSHNMGAVRELCMNAVLLKNGKLNMCDSSHNIIHAYINNVKASVPSVYVSRENTNKEIFFKRIEVCNNQRKSRNTFLINERICVLLYVHGNFSNKQIDIGISVNDVNDRRVFIDKKTFNVSVKDFYCKIILPESLLTPNFYSMDFAIEEVGYGVKDLLRNAIGFDIIKADTEYENLSYDYGLINTKCFWEV